MMNTVPVQTGSPSKTRLFFGGVIFISGFLSPLFIPIVTGSNLSTEWKAILSGVLVLGVPEVFMLIAIIILGKQGFDFLKSHLWKLIRPADKVSATRYRIGLILFFSPILFGWLYPYMELWVTGLEAYRLGLAITGDVIFAISLFVLGGDFWLKIKALFIHDSTASGEERYEDRNKEKYLTVNLIRYVCGNCTGSLTIVNFFANATSWC